MFPDRGLFTDREPFTTEVNEAYPVDDLECKAGDLWQVGRHRILVGDSTDTEALERALGDLKPDILHADPPYGIKLSVNWSESIRRGIKYRPVIGDDRPFDPQPLLGLGIPTMIFWGANHYANRLPNSPHWLIWDKQCKNGLHRDHGDGEMAWVNRKGNVRIFRHTWDGFRRDSEKGVRRIHPNQKSIACIEWVLSWFAGEVVLDPYLGSGSTVLACEKVGKTCVGIEIDPEYVGKSLLRIQAATGLVPTLLERTDI